jgi:hypothetical protein
MIEFLIHSTQFASGFTSGLLVGGTACSLIYLALAGTLPLTRR